MRKGFFAELFSGMYLAIFSSSLLGYLIALRILNWNPVLWNDWQNIVGLTIFTTLLYVVLGIIVGIFATLAFKALFRLFSKSRQSKLFIRFWIGAYSLITILLFAYLTITRSRPDAHIKVYDTFLIVVYVLSLLILFWLIWSRMSKKSIGVFRASFVPLMAYVVIAFLISFICTKKLPPPKMGNIDEIEAAFSHSNSEIKVAIFGIDGAEWSVIDSLIANGKMPVSRRIIENGFRADFKSLPSTKSPLVWTSIITGKEPIKHGIEDFGSFQFPLMKSSFINYPDGIGFYRLVYTLFPSADLPVTSTTRKVESLWDLLSRAGRSVGIAGWWASWPADPVNGWMISDRFTYTLFNPRTSARSLKEKQVYPDSLLNILLKYVRLPDDMTKSEISRFIKGDVDRGFAPDGWVASGHEEWNPLYQLKTGYTAGETFFNASMHLIEQQGQPDFYAIYLEGNDMVSHFFWQYMDDSLYPEQLPEAEIKKFDEVIPRFYCYWDSLLGAAIQRLDEDTHIIVLSDHGFGATANPVIPYRGGDHRLYGVLYGMGPHFKKNYNAKEANVLDITPTLLYLYGLPVAEDMDGEVLLEIFENEFIAENPLEQISSYETGRRTHSSLTNSEVDEAIKEQLRSLGYTK